MEGDLYRPREPRGTTLWTQRSDGTACGIRAGVGRECRTATELPAPTGCDRRSDPGVSPEPRTVGGCGGGGVEKNFPQGRTQHRSAFLDAALIEAVFERIRARAGEIARARGLSIEFRTSRSDRFPALTDSRIQRHHRQRAHALGLTTMAATRRHDAQDICSHFGWFFFFGEVGVFFFWFGFLGVFGFAPHRMIFAASWT